VNENILSIEKIQEKENNMITIITLFLHIVLVIITALLCWDGRKDKIQFILCMGALICWIALAVNEAIYLFG